MDVDVHDDVNPGPEVADDLAFQGSVEISVDDCVFEEIPCVEPLLEILIGQEMIIHAVFLSWAWDPGRAGDGVADIAGVCEAAAKRGFARP